MKIQGYLKGTGKLGNIVCSRVAGQTIARDYNPNVANPNTVAQMNQRARLKLASQLAAALSPVIAIPKEGLISSRNLFIKKNMESIIANNGEAQIIYENIQLTNGTAALPGITATRTAGVSIAIQLQDSADAAVSRVIYVVYKKNSEEMLQYVGSAIVDTAGENGTFPAEFADFDGDVIIWAYGIKDKTSAATVKYGSYSVVNGEDVARLLMNRTLSADEYQTTQTRGTTLFDDEEGTIEAGENQYMVYVNSSGPGTAAIQGQTANRVAITQGQNVTVVATPNTGCQFLGWQISGQTGYVSTEATYTFAVNAAADLIAVFNDPNSSNSGDAGFNMGD